MTLFIDGRWQAGTGPAFASTDPSDGSTVWQGASAAAADVARAVAAARAAFPGWAATPLVERVAAVRRFAEALKAGEGPLAEAICRETGKPLWEGRAEVATMIAKVATSIAAQAERAGERETAAAFGRAVLRHRPHGLMAVLGPYNFPGHLPNGHIVPALLAGDTVVFKPSEEAPLTAELTVKAWEAAGLPPGVVNLVQGGKDAGAALIDQEIDGLLFTGSAAAGAHFRRAFVDRPHVILALELGGNNPLIAWDGDPAAVASIVVQSAFVTAGQRCSCARRLIVPEGAAGGAFVEATVALAGRLVQNRWDATPEPFMGPLVSVAAAERAEAQLRAAEAAGARPIIPWRRDGAFVAPALYDVTGLDVPDEEIFAPVLQVIRVPDFDAAIAAANATRYGLSAGLVSADRALWDRALNEMRAGVLNWNRPTTGAAGTAPFGGLGASGNHRPSAYYAADYCAYPVASFEADAVLDQSGDIKGLRP